MQMKLDHLDLNEGSDSIIFGKDFDFGSISVTGGVDSRPFEDGLPRPQNDRQTYISLNNTGRLVNTQGGGREPEGTGLGGYIGGVPSLGDGGDIETGGALLGGSLGQQQSLGGYWFWQLASYRPYFNVTTVAVRKRIRQALFPFRLGGRRSVSSDHGGPGLFWPPPDSLEGGSGMTFPDLYGPLWISITLLLLLAASGNFASRVAHISTQRTSHVKGTVSRALLSKDALQLTSDTASKQIAMQEVGGGTFNIDNSMPLPGFPSFSQRAFNQSEPVSAHLKMSPVAMSTDGAQNDVLTHGGAVRAHGYHQTTQSSMFGTLASIKSIRQMAEVTPEADTKGTMNKGQSSPVSVSLPTIGGDAAGIVKATSSASANQSQDSGEFAGLFSNANMVPWKARFDKLSAGSSVVTAALFVPAAAIWASMIYYGSKRRFAELVSLSGYALSPYVAAAFVCALPLSWLQWVAQLTASSIAIQFVTRSLKPDLMQLSDSASLSATGARLVLTASLLVGALYSVLGFAFKWTFF